MRAIFALCLVLLSAPASADPWKAIEQRLAAEYPKGGPGAYAIVAKGGDVLYSHGFGLADIEQNVPWSADSVVRIASLTKQFTAAAVLQLVESGKLGLEDTLAERLPDCPAAWRAITVRELLAQTSGLTDDLSPLLEHIAEDLAPNRILGVYADRPLDFAPGTRWRYSNLNYWILGRLIEIASGESYAGFVARHVLAPGMTRTRYGSNGAVIAGRAHGYEAEPGGAWSNARYFSATLGYAAGGFLSTPHDMAVWYAALSRGAILSPKMLALALTENHTSDGKPTGYGLGWYVSRDGRAHHGGSTFGFQSSIIWDPARGLFAGVFKNESDERGEPEEDARIALDAAGSR
jgi:CubicO group peptidase (beta-lactamase class C family)